VGEGFRLWLGLLRGTLLSEGTAWGFAAGGCALAGLVVKCYGVGRPLHVCMSAG
jgi:hypothetical protein